MKKIVIDARIISTPTGRYAVKLLDYLQKLDSENQYIVLVKPKDKEYYKPTNKNFSIMTCPYKDFTFGEQIGYWFYLHRLKADLVHFCMPQQPIFYLKPKVTTFHDLIILDYINRRGGNPIKVFYKHTIKPIVYKLVVRRFINWSDHVLTVSHYTKNDITKRLKPKTDITVTYNAADPAKGKTSAYKPIGSDPFITFVGNTAPYKNLENLIKAMPEINKQTGVKLLVVGKANDFTDWLQGIAKKEAPGLVEWTGFVSDEELRWLYENTMVHTVPSLFEGFGIGGIEAISYGAPVVASNNTCMPEVYGEAAHYFDPHSIEDIAKQTIRVITDSKLRSRLSKEAPKQLGKYSWEDTAQKTLEVYKKYW